MKPQQSMLDVLACVYRVQSSFGGKKETQEPFRRTVNVFMCEFVWICFSSVPVFGSDCMWGHALSDIILHVLMCVHSQTHTHWVSVVSMLFGLFCATVGCCYCKKNKIIKNLMSSQHHCSKYTKKKLVCMKIMEKNCISTLLVCFL